jgi:hypothetical protein
VSSLIWGWLQKKEISFHFKSKVLANIERVPFYNAVFSEELA